MWRSLIMSNGDSMKSMPYRIAEGDMELMKIRCSAAVARTAATKHSRCVVRWGISLAMVASVLLAFVVVNRFVEPNRYELFIEQLADMPEDVLYDMSVDVIEYEEDMTLL